jgi:hypothetical protein
VVLADADQLFVAELIEPNGADVHGWDCKVYREPLERPLERPGRPQ